jgi:GT2 family glycosyltransferase
LTPQPEQAPAAPSIAIVVVTKNQRTALERALEAAGSKHQVIVVDSGSGDGVGLDPRFKITRLISLPRHFGLTRALNIGIRAAEAAEYVLLLSPEVELKQADIVVLAATLENEPSTGAVAPLLADATGTAIPQVGDLPSKGDPQPALRAAKPGERPPFTRGDAILFRSFFLRALRQIDERYGDYGSAAELCQQVRRANKTILIHPAVTARAAFTPSPETPARAADREIGTARFLSKHKGAVAGWSYLIGRMFAALFSLQLRKFLLLVQLKKIDGT